MCPRTRLGLLVLLLFVPSGVFGLPPRVRERIRAVPTCCRLCTTGEERASERIPWGPARLDVREARVFLEQALELLGEDPREYRLEDTLKEWARGSRSLSLVRRDGRGFDLFLLARAVGENGDRCAVCFVGEFSLLAGTDEWRYVREDQLALMRAAHASHVGELRQAAEHYRDGRTEELPAWIRKRWGEFYEELATHFDPAAYNWSIRVLENECHVVLSPNFESLPSRSGEVEDLVDGTVLVMDIGDWRPMESSFLRDPGTRRCVTRRIDGRTSIRSTRVHHKGRLSERGL